jgi:acyl-CoA dehydrogenase
MLDSIDRWLSGCRDPANDPTEGMREAGLLEPAPDYATIARVEAALVERTGLLGIASVWSGRQLVYRHFLSFGTDTQWVEWSGRALSVAISEPEVGAHPKLLTTRADVIEGGFRISGRKAWVSNGPTADAIIVFAITAEEAGRKRYSAFIVPRETAGLTTIAMPGFHALRPSQHCLLTLDSCFVPESAMLGQLGLAYECMALPFRDIEDAVGTTPRWGRCATRSVSSPDRSDRDKRRPWARSLRWRPCSRQEPRRSWVRWTKNCYAPAMRPLSACGFWQPT